jgi:hypothetical protein
MLPVLEGKGTSLSSKARNGVLGSGMVVRECNPNYLQGEDRKTMVLGHS